MTRKSHEDARWYRVFFVIAGDLFYRIEVAVMTEARITTALVRAVPQSFDRCIKPDGAGEPIDVELARDLHLAYVRELERTVDSVVRIPADDRYPDCCFVEDPVIVVGGVVIVCNMAAPTRRGEEDAIENELGATRSVVRLLAPATLDGGDVLIVGSTVFVGISRRSNMDCVGQLRRAVAVQGYNVIPVKIDGILHLKSGCTRVGDRTLLIDRARVDATPFRQYELLDVPAEESYAANALLVNDVILMSRGFPITGDKLRATGREVVELDTTEFRKAGGSLTCLSILI